MGEKPAGISAWQGSTLRGSARATCKDSCPGEFEGNLGWGSGKASKVHWPPLPAPGSERQPAPLSAQEWGQEWSSASGNHSCPRGWAECE